MATITKGQTFAVTEQITNTKLHNLVDNATIASIVNADIAANAEITDSRLAVITSANNVGGTAIYGLSSLPTTSGLIPNLRLPALIKQNNLAINSLASLYSAHIRSLSMTGTITAINSANTLTSLANSVPTESVVKSYADAKGGYSHMQAFTSSGTWTRPAGVDKVYVKVWGGGGGGKESGTAGGGGGGYSEGITAVTGNVSVTVGTGGGSNSNGGTSSFAASTTIQATGGVAGNSTSAGGVGSNGTVNLTGQAGHATGYIGGQAPIGGVGGIVQAQNGALPGGGGAGHASSQGGTGGAGLVIVYWTQA